MDGCSLMPTAWGDYADILQHGMIYRDPRLDGALSLQRTGPFIPPITLPLMSEVLVTSEAKTTLESSNLTGFSFRLVKKTHIVELRWEDWDFSNDELPEYPESGEPEDFISERPHSPATAAALGEIWEIVVPRTAKIRRPRPIVNSYKELKIDMATWDGSDLIRGEGYGSMLFSERARDFFSENWGLYLQFDEFPTT